MIKILFYTGLAILLIYMMFCSFQIVHLSASIKYETNNTCISTITGKNLCELKKHYKLVALFILLGMFILLFLQNKIFSSSKKR